MCADDHLISLCSYVIIIASSHNGIDANVSIEGRSRQHSRVSGAPLDVKAPLSTCGKLIQDLSATKIEKILVLNTTLMLKPRYPSLTIMVLTQILSYFQVFSLSFLTSNSGSMIFLKQQYCKCLPQPCWDSSKESYCLSHSSGGALDLLRSTLWRAHLYTYTNRISKILRKYGYLMINL